MNKKKTFLVAFLIAASTLVACGSGENGNQEAKTEAESEIKEIEGIVKEKKVEEKLLESVGELGEFGVEIKDFELTKDYAGSPTIVINYTFTNNSEEANSAMVALSTQAFQNGVQLETAIADSVNSEDSMKKLKTGASIDVKAAYILKNETSPVEFEVSELISFSEDKLGKTFILDEAGETVYSEAPEGDVSQELGDYRVSIVDYQMGKDYEEKPVIVINLGFTNNSSETSSYMTALHCTAYQDGVQLETAIVTDEEIAIGTSQMTNIRPGVGIPVAVAFELTSETSPVEIEITEFLSFSDEKLETTINIAN